MVVVVGSWSWLCSCLVTFFLLVSRGRVRGSIGAISRAVVGRKRLRNAFPDVVERVLTHVVDVARLPALLAHALLVLLLLAGARLAHRQLRQGAGQTALQILQTIEMRLE